MWTTGPCSLTNFTLQVWDQPGTSYGQMDHHHKITGAIMELHLVCVEACKNHSIFFISPLRKEESWYVASHLALTRTRYQLAFLNINPVLRPLRAHSCVLHTFDLNDFKSKWALFLKCASVEEGIVIKVTIALSTQCVWECFWEEWGPLGQQKEPHPSWGRDHSQGNSYHKPWALPWHTLCFLSLSLFVFLSLSFLPVCFSSL